jgi:ABC-2 type transport system ATP-binding protein/lipopolysaccharide transport system ATP-binding protein
MASITLQNASVEIPVFAVGNNSLKTSLLRRAVGGRFARAGSNLVVTAINNVSLQAESGDRIGVIGHNGSGKTTLLRLLAGVYPPTKGFARVVGRVSPMFDISLGMSPDATGFENVRTCGTLWGLSRREIDAGIDDIIEFTELGDYLSIPVRTYSAGMLLRLSFAIATLRRPEILLLDEIIGVGDTTFIAKAKARVERMISQSEVLVLSSHIEAIIRTFCNKVIWLDQGNVAGFGGVDEVMAAYHQANARLAGSQPAAPARVNPAR